MIKPPARIQRLQPCALDLSPIEVASRCRALAGLVFLDAALPDQGALSIIAARPSQILTGRTDADWEFLRQLLARRCVPENLEGPIPPGFVAGWVDYDGAFHFGLYDRLLAFQHCDTQEKPGGIWYSVGGFHEELPSATDWTLRSPSLEFRPTLPKEEFLRMVRRAQEYIAAGDIYQVNLSHRLVAKWVRKGNEADAAFALYETLRRCSPAPWAALLAGAGRRILSSSPELFLEIAGRHIRTRPIKGTRPRRAEREADDQNARELISSSKEAAELIMITDLERNDLGQVCEYGSVRTSELLKLERFRQVFHLVSTVDGQLRPEVGAVDALRACFPGGSITGAPKKRAMEIIAELEPIPRGLYTGAIGYFGFNGVSRFNIAIRTVVIENDRAHFHVGAGIVADSEPEREWQETLDKAAGILLAAGAEDANGPAVRPG